MPVSDARPQTLALVVDDTPESLGFVAGALEEHGITVIVARDGATAIDLAARVSPDVILMDAVMPGLDGFETCRRLTSDARPTTAPIIFMTGLTEPEHIVRALASGGVDYVCKPVVVEELIARITTHVSNAKLIRSAQEALDRSGRALVAFAETGRLAWGSPDALAQMSDKTTTGDEDAALLAWLHTCRTSPASTVPPHDRWGCSLVFVGITTSGEVLAKLIPPEVGAPVDRIAKAFGLTRREAEVLYWLSFGKTNRDIGQILDLSARTVNKHLEQVFAKMGVDNRTSAAVMANRAMHL